MAGDPPPSSGPGGVLTIHAEPRPDLKAVFATVESADTLQARARIGGTVGALAVDEGDRVSAGQKLAVVADEKLILQMEAAEARVRSLTAELAQATLDQGRAQALRAQGAAPQQRLDEARTRTRMLTQTLEAAGKERDVLARQIEEGAVLAPAAGRVLDVAVTDGAVVLPGETLATIASDTFLLRMRLPERHARFLRVGDTVQVGPRGLDPRASGAFGTGRVVQVYPRLHDGRVIADVAVDNLGDYFVGERALVYVSTGERRVMRVPVSFLHHRFGLTYATLENGAQVVVQTGQRQDGMVEVLSGLQDGDRVIAPPTPEAGS
ncbi:efflux RND transporter periplasmic adaptor subunit [Pararhodospirillum oryzae]|uniref:Membrane protein n=1 Tax=Pararhodospirillum oryzae TaxID=478448 RepID=A0A512H7R2_9PROT|nr:efflux RND transporter periplasmic adaptor subunit [Pararhodospirillum oryzae]GEO81468.1 membrane protein [Pararhodospirillum oryzae]